MGSFHKTLNTKLWLPDNSLKPEVSKKLKEIASTFIDFLEIPEGAVQDIVITGSCASFNYTPYSDIDLHLLVDFEKVHKDCPIVQGYLLSKKSEFNKNHDISIYGIPVEVYAEPLNNENVHNGLYSLKQGKWLEEPQKIAPPKNSRAVNAKFKEFKEAAENVVDGDVAKQLIEKIKDMRKVGLYSAGEFSVENLVFKKLRNEGIIGKLMDIKKEKVDRDLSLEEALEIIESTVGRWATAAAGSRKEREEKADAAKKAYEFIKNNTSSDIRDYVKPDKELTKKGAKRKKFSKDDYDYDAYYNAQKNVRSAKEASQKADLKAVHAKNVDELKLPKNSKVSTKKLTDAARDSWSERFDKNQDKLLHSIEPGSANKTAKREARARNIKFTDPNWERKNKKIKATRDQLKRLFSNSEALDLYENLISSIEEMMGMGTTIAGMMGTQPNPVAGQEQPSKYRKEGERKEKPAMYKYNYQKVRRHKDMNIKEMMEEIASTCEAIEKVTLQTGHREGDDSNEYRVQTTHDKGKIETKIRANSPEEAVKLVQKFHGGPDSAHKLMEEIADFCGKIFEYDEEHGNPQPHNKALNKLKDDIAVLKSRRRHAKKEYPRVEKEANSLREYRFENPLPYWGKLVDLDKLAADRWDKDKEIDDKVTRRNKLQNLKGLTSPKYL